MVNGSENSDSGQSVQYQDLLQPKFHRAVGDLKSAPVIHKGRLRFASPAATGGLSSPRTTAVDFRTPDQDDFVWCELFASPEVGKAGLAIFHRDTEVQAGEPAEASPEPAEPKEILTFHWKTAVSRKEIRTASNGVASFTLLEFVFSSCDPRADPRFSSSEPGEPIRSRLDQVACVVATQEEADRWTEKLEASLQVIPAPKWKGFLRKKPTKGSLGAWKLRYFVLDGHSLHYFTDETLRDKKGTMRLNTGANVVLALQRGVPTLTLTVPPKDAQSKERKLVAQSHHRNADEELQRAELKNWSDKFQQQLDDLKDLEAAFNTDDEEDSEPVDASLVQCWVKVYDYLRHPSRPRWESMRLTLRTTPENNILRLEPRGTDPALELPFYTATTTTTAAGLTTSSTLAHNNSLGKDLGLEIAHPDGLHFLYACEPRGTSIGGGGGGGGFDDGGGGVAGSVAGVHSPKLHKALVTRLRQQTVRLAEAAAAKNRGGGTGAGEATTTTHHLVIDRFEVDLGDKTLNVRLDWFLDTEPEFRQSAGTRLCVTRARWEQTFKYAVNAASARSANLIVQLLAVEEGDGGGLDGSGGGPFSYMRLLFQERIPLSTLVHSYQDDTSKAAEQVQHIHEEVKLGFRAFLEPAHLLTASNLQFSLAEAPEQTLTTARSPNTAPSPFLGQEDDAASSPSIGAFQKFMRKLGEFEMKHRDADTTVCNRLQDKEYRDLTSPCLVDATAAVEDRDLTHEGRRTLFPAQQFQLQQVTSLTRMDFRFAGKTRSSGQPPKLLGFATVTGEALLQSLQTRTPVTVPVEVLKTMHTQGSRLKLSVSFHREPNFESHDAFAQGQAAEEEEEEEGLLDKERGEEVDVEASATSRGGGTRDVEGLKDESGRGGAAGGGAPREEGIFADPFTRGASQVGDGEMAGYVTKLPTSMGFTASGSSLTGQYERARREMKRKGKRRYLTLKNRVLSYYQDESRRALKGSLQLTRNSNVEEIDVLPLGHKVTGLSDRDTGKLVNLAFTAADETEFAKWKMALLTTIRAILVDAQPEVHVSPDPSEHDDDDDVDEPVEVLEDSDPEHADHRDSDHEHPDRDAFDHEGSDRGVDGDHASTPPSLPAPVPAPAPAPAPEQYQDGRAVYAEPVYPQQQVVVHDPQPEVVVSDHITVHHFPDPEVEATRKEARRRTCIIVWAIVLGVLMLGILLLVIVMSIARLRVTSTGVMIESDIPQLTRPPNAVSAALWLRGQSEYAFTNPGYMTVCVSHVHASFFYVDTAAATGLITPTLTKITPASTVDLMFPQGGVSSGVTDTCVPPFGTVKVQIPFEVRVMLSPALTQSISDDCSTSAQRFAVNALGTGSAYVKSVPWASVPTLSLNHVENIPCNPDAVAPSLPQPTRFQETQARLKRTVPRNHREQALTPE